MVSIRKLKTFFYRSLSVAFQKPNKPTESRHGGVVFYWCLTWLLITHLYQINQSIKDLLRRLLVSEISLPRLTTRTLVTRLNFLGGSKTHSRKRRKSRSLELCTPCQNITSFYLRSCSKCETVNKQFLCCGKLWSLSLFRKWATLNCWQ